MNAEINLRVNNDLDSAAPRAVESINRIKSGMASVLETTQKSTEAFREWMEQVRTVQSAQAVDMATRPSGGQTAGSALDPQGRPIMGPGAASPVGSVMDMKRSFDELIDTIESLTKELERDGKAPRAGGGTVEDAGGGGGGRKRNKIAPNDGDQAPKAEDGISIDRYRQARGLGGILSNFAHGKPVEAALSAGQGAVDSMADGWKGLSGLARGGLIAGGGLLALGVGANELSKTYEEKAGTAVDLYGQMGLYKSGNNSQGIRRNMAEVSREAGAEGYTFDQGAAATTSLLRSGVSASNVTAERASVLRYARYMGLSPQDLTGFQGLAAKTGNGNLIGLGLGGAEAQGIGSGRALEYLQGIQEVLEDGFRDGIKVDAKETSKAMNWLGQQDVWKGGAGAQMWNQIRSGISRATGLSQQNDALIFRAASAQAGGEFGKAGGKDWQTLLKMENPDVGTVSGIWGQIQKSTGGNAFDSRMMLKNTLGLTASQTENLTQLLTDPAKNADKIKAVLKEAGSSESTEKDFWRTTEEFQQLIRNVAMPFFDGKNTLAKSILDMSKAVIHGFGGDPEKPTSAEISGGKGSQFRATTLKTSLPAYEDIFAEEKAGTLPKGSTSTLDRLYKMVDSAKLKTSAEFSGSKTVQALAADGIQGNELGPLLVELVRVLEGNTAATKEASKLGIKFDVPVVVAPVGNTPR